MRHLNLARNEVTAFIHSKKAPCVHSHIHLAITGDASFIHSIRANTFTQITRIVATKGGGEEAYVAEVYVLSLSPILFVQYGRLHPSP